MLNLEDKIVDYICTDMARVRDERTGKFCLVASEPISKKQIGVRLPVSMEEKLRQIAGKDMSAWVREAIAEKLEREQQASA